MTETEPDVTAELAAAALLLKAAGHGDGLTEIERDQVAAAMMKLFRIDRPDAKKLNKTVLADDLHAQPVARLCAALSEVDTTRREHLLGHIRTLAETAAGDEVAHSFRHEVAECLAMREEGTAALTPGTEGA